MYFLSFLCINQYYSMLVPHDPTKIIDVYQKLRIEPKVMMFTEVYQSLFY
jgi:hypothetical protein